MYQFTDDNDVVVRLSDGAAIPRGHRWWGDYEAWLAEGNTPAAPPDNRPLEVRARRDAELMHASRVLERHRNQVDFGLPPSLTTLLARAWAVYAQQLRDLPGLPGFPDVEFPTPPSSESPGLSEAPLNGSIAPD